jgi:hypothetical protein
MLQYIVLKVVENSVVLQTLSSSGNASFVSSLRNPTELQLIAVNV